MLVLFLVCFLLVKGNLPKLALPDGWIALNHRSGGIIYLHKPTRVCTWSRPYHIGGGSVRVTLCFLLNVLVGNQLSSYHMSLFNLQSFRSPV